MKAGEADFQAWMVGIQARMEAALARLLPAAHIAPARLHEAMRYAALEGGKRVRPLLAFAAGELVQASPERLEAAAAAVEMIHAYSLVHDDLPCMDDDVLRRGKPTLHVEFDEATALLVGDALQSLAFQLLAEHRLCDEPQAQLDMIRTLAAAAGSRGMAGGQQIDLDATGKALALPELELMHIHKTGALIRAAVLLGFSCGHSNEAERAALDRYAKAIGLAFQVVDDILDVTADSQTLGKTAGKDAAADKPTYVSLWGLDGARAQAKQLLAESLAALERSGLADTAALRALAHMVVDRDR